MDGMDTARRLIAEEREKKTGFLDLGNLRLTEVPPALFELTHLRSLNLGTGYIDEHGRFRQSANGEDENRNALVTLPEGLDALDNLIALSLAGNPVSDLGPLRGLPALQNLDCSNTPVSDLTPLIDLESLTKLNASRCRLSDLPRSLVLSETLARLTLYETTIPGIPLELLSPDEHSSCLEALRNHLADLEAGAEEVREAKLVVLGNGRVGKTQLCRRANGGRHGVSQLPAALLAGIRAHARPEGLSRGGGANPLRPAAAGSPPPAGGR